MPAETGIDQIKAIGNYKVMFKSSFNADDEDKIYLQISVTDDVKEILQKAKSVENTDLVEFNHYDGEEYSALKRYKVKNWVYGSLYSNSNGKEILFTKKLVDTGKLELSFVSIPKIEQFISDLKENFRRLIETMLKSTRIDQTINYNPTR